MKASRTVSLFTRACIASAASLMVATDASGSNDNAIKRAEAEIANERYSSAVWIMQKEIARSKNNAQAYLVRARAYAQLKQYKKAQIDCETCLLLDSKSADAHAVLGGVYGSLRQYKLAIEECNEAIALDPKLAKAYCNRGIANAYLRNYQESISDCTKAISLHPSEKKLTAYVYNQRGTDYAKIDKNANAIADYSQAIARAPNWALPYVNREKIYRYQGKTDLAEKDAAMARKLGFPSTSNP